MAKNIKSSSYFISEEDNIEIQKWNDEHKFNCKCYDDGLCVSSPTGAIGGRLTYCFTPTGLGLIITVECACGEVLDLTSYDQW